MDKFSMPPAFGFLRYADIYGAPAHGPTVIIRNLFATGCQSTDELIPELLFAGHLQQCTSAMVISGQNKVSAP